MKGLKIGAILSFIISMGILLLGGYLAKDKLAPYPEKVVIGEKVVITSKDIKDGQNVYQKYGLMDHGSIWGHGSLRGMDFSATTLHMIGRDMREYYAGEKGKGYSDLSEEEKSIIDDRVIKGIKTNTYHPSKNVLTLTSAEAYALEKIRDYWKNLLKNGDKDNGFLPNTVKDEEERSALANFFFWTAWVAGTNRPGENYTYTNNWPPDRTVGNILSPDAFVWSILSIIGLLVVLGLIIYIVHRHQFFYGKPRGVEIGKELIKLRLTNSQLKAAKFFLVVIILFILQTMMGGLLAHYTVHPGTFYLDFIAKLVPYS